jgi:hypothetical protein
MDLPPIFALRQKNEQWLVSIPIIQEVGCIPVIEAVIAAGSISLEDIRVRYLPDLVARMPVQL